RLSGWSRQIRTAFQESRTTRETPKGDCCLTATGLSPTPADHSRPFTFNNNQPQQAGRPTTNAPTTPHTQPLPSITRAWFSQPPLSLATTHGITIVFSSYGY